MTRRIADVGYRWWVVRKVVGAILSLAVLALLAWTLWPLFLLPLAELW